MPCRVCSESSGFTAEADQDEEDVFQPSKGNVAFGSASDGWAFRLDQFADMYSAKLGAKPAALVQVSVVEAFCSMGFRLRICSSDRHCCTESAAFTVRIVHLWLWGQLT